MSWFKKTVRNHEIEDAPLTEEDRKNPFIGQEIEEEFVKVPLAVALHPVKVATEGTDGDTNFLTNLS